MVYGDFREIKFSAGVLGYQPAEDALCSWEGDGGDVCVRVQVLLKKL